MPELHCLDAVLEDMKQAVLAMKDRLDEAGVIEQEVSLHGLAAVPAASNSREHSEPAF